MSRSVTITTSKMGNDLGISQQSVSRWLISLEEEGYIERKEGIRGYILNVTESGKNYIVETRNNINEILLESKKMRVYGVVISGMNDGKYYIGLKEYEKKLETTLGFKPFPGTLNIKLNGIESVQSKENLSSKDSMEIPGFTIGERTFGAIKCFPCSISGINGAIIIPERSHYGYDVLELVSSHNLREKLDISDGDKVEVDVKV